MLSNESPSGSPPPPARGGSGWPAAIHRISVKESLTPSAGPFGRADSEEFFFRL
jgi:hypothetical protein